MFCDFIVRYVITNLFRVRLKFYDTKQELHVQKLHFSVEFIW